MEHPGPWRHVGTWRGVEGTGTSQDKVGTIALQDRKGTGTLKDMEGTRKSEGMEGHEGDREIPGHSKGGDKISLGHGRTWQGLPKPWKDAEGTGHGGNMEGTGTPEAIARGQDCPGT